MKLSYGLLLLTLLLSSNTTLATHIAKKAVQTPAEHCMTLNCVRNNIDEIDTHIVNLIGLRLTYVKQAGILKKNNRPVHDGKREAMILTKVTQLAKEQGTPASLIINVYKTLLAQTNLYEQQFTRS